LKTGLSISRNMPWLNFQTAAPYMYIDIIIAPFMDIIGEFSSAS